MNLRELLKAWGRALNRCFPKRKNQILFESHSDYCDNTRAVYDELLRQGGAERFRLIWCVKDPASFQADGIDPRTKLVSFQRRKGFLRYFYWMATSGMVFYTHHVPPFVNAKAQTVVNLWHGTPLKTIKGHIHPQELFGYLLSASDLVDDLLADSFELPDRSKLVQLGYPRNDLLFEQTGALEKLGIHPKDQACVLLWMPTFRRPEGGRYQDAETTPTGLPLIETAAQLEELNRELEQRNLRLIIKLHPGQDLTGVRLVHLSRIRMLTNQELDRLGIQLYHLVGEADCLLTDYSSIYFDYLLLDRPIAFLIDDIAQYQQNRGFTVENALDLMPGEKIRTVSELNGFLDRLAKGEDRFQEDRQRVNRRVNRWQDGERAKRFLERFLPG